VGTGDCLVVAEWDRATRSMMDGIAIIDRIKKRESLLKVLVRSYLDLTGCGINAFLSALAADERKRILARCAGGRKAARARGVKFGQAQTLRSSASGSTQAAGSRRKRLDHR
jgi:DNA invertase Pin-like site-specific DNA recombinase